MSSVTRRVRRGTSSIGSAARSVTREVARAPSNVASAAMSVAKEAQRFAKSDIGKAAIAAGALYFGGTALMGAMGKGGMAAGGITGSGAMGGQISGGFMSQIATGGVASGAAGGAATGGFLTSLKGAAGTAFGAMKANPELTMMAGNMISGAAQGYADRRNLKAAQAHDQDMLERERQPRVEAGDSSSYGSHLGLLRRRNV